MGANLGTIRLEIDTTPAAAPTWKQVNHEMSVDESWEADFEDVISKDTGKFKDGIKSFLSASLSVKAVDDNVAGSKLDYEAVKEIYLENNNDTQRGRRKMRLLSSTSGRDTVEFVGVITSCKRGNDAASVSTFDFDVKIVAYTSTTAVA